nr:hypothetical protein [Tanacetum cinerariifolium]
VYVSGMKHGFLSQKEGEGGRGVKEKDNNGTTEKNNKHDEHAAGNKNNTNGLFGLGLDNGFPPSVDVTGKADGSVVSSPAVDELVVAAGNTKDVNVGQTPISVTVDPNLGTSYAKLFTGESSRKSVNFRTFIIPAGNATYVVVPLEYIRATSERFDNTAYGFFLEKQVAYPVVANYVRNTCGKYGRIRLMHNLSTGLFFFQFSSMDGFNSMLENDPWFIRNNPLSLKRWNPYVNLLKEDVGNVSVWVKLHGVFVTTFREDGLSVISTKLGTPLMLYSYTSNMCMQSYGRSSYVKAMIELWAEVESKDTIVVAMPKLVGEGFYTCTIHVEYE